MTYKENFKKYLFGLFSSIFASCAMLNVAMADGITVKYCCKQNGVCEENEYVTRSVSAPNYTFGQFNDVCGDSASSAWWAWSCGTSSSSINSIYYPGSENYESDNLFCRPSKNMVFAIYLEGSGESFKDFDYGNWCSGTEISVSQFGGVFGLESTDITSLNSDYKGWCIGSEASDGWYAGQAVFECTAKTAENPNLSCTTIQDYMTSHSVNHVFIRLAMDTVDYKCSNDGAVLDQHSLLPDRGPAEPLSSLELCGKSGWDCVKGVTHPVGGDDECTKTCSAAGDVVVWYAYANGTCENNDVLCNNAGARQILQTGFGFSSALVNSDFCFNVLSVNDEFKSTSCNLTAVELETLLGGTCTDPALCNVTFTPKKNGYKIQGWYHNNNIDPANIIDAENGAGLKSIVQESWLNETNLSNGTYQVTLFPKWEPIQFNITYDSESVAGSNNSEVNTDNTYDITESFSIHDIEKDGWIFLGWCEQDGCEHPLRGENSPVMELPSDVDWMQTEEDLHEQFDKHFYARWEKDGPCDDGNYIDADQQCTKCPTEYPSSDSSEGGNVGKESCYFLCPPALEGLDMFPASLKKVYYREGVSQEAAIAAECTAYEPSCLDGKWLHVGDGKMCLISGDPSATQKPALRIQRGNKKYYLPLKDSSVDGGMPMTCDSTKKLHLHWNNKTYDAYDELAEYCMSIGESSGSGVDNGQEESDGFLPVGVISSDTISRVNDRHISYDNSTTQYADMISQHLIDALESGDHDGFAEVAADAYTCHWCGGDGNLDKTVVDEEKLKIVNWATKIKNDYKKQSEIAFGGILRNISVHNCGQALMFIKDGEPRPRSVNSLNVYCYEKDANDVCLSYKIQLSYDSEKCVCPGQINAVFENNSPKTCNRIRSYQSTTDSICIYSCN